MLIQPAFTVDIYIQSVTFHEYILYFLMFTFKTAIICVKTNMPAPCVCQGLSEPGVIVSRGAGNVSGVFIFSTCAASVTQVAQTTFCMCEKGT